jgi:AraC-like DNA-binding protein
MPGTDDLVVYFAERAVAEEREVWPDRIRKPFHILFMCLSGRFRVSLRKKVWELGEQEFLFFRADRIDDVLEAVELPMEYQWASFFSEDAQRIPTHPTGTDFTFLNQLFKRLQHSYRHNGANSEITTFWMKSIVQALKEDHVPEEPAAAAGDGSRPVRTVIRELNAHPEHFRSVTDLCRRAGFSKTHFFRLFKQLTGQSPQQYLVNARTLRAESLLKETGLSIGRIAEELGYRDVYHFSKQFKAVRGKTPSAVRKEARE